MTEPKRLSELLPDAVQHLADLGNPAKFVIMLPWRTPPISMNDRLGHWAKAAKVAEVRHAAGWSVKAARIGRHQRVRIELHYRPRTRRTRDSDNLAATYKHCVDGCVDAHLVPDDTDAYVERGWPTIHDPVKGKPGRLWLEIHVLGGSR